MKETLNHFPSIGEGEFHFCALLNLPPSPSLWRGNGALPAAWYLARNFAGMRLAELGSAAGDAAYSAVSMAISRFEKRLKADRDLQRRIKAVRKILQL